MNQSLARLNIVVTRPREQAVALAQGITAAGGQAILFPLLEISPVADPQPLQALVARLHEFQLAIFISPNAVNYGMAAILAALSPSPSPASPARGAPVGAPLLCSDPSAGGRGVRNSAGEGNPSALPLNLKIATVGQGSAKLLRDYGVKNIIAPQDRFDSEALLALPELLEITGWRVVIFRGDGGRELLGDTLKARGATVEYIACYQRAKPQQDAATLLAAHPHAITLTSSEALGYLWDMLDASARKQLIAVPLLVPHARIAEAAHKLGWQEVITTAGGDDGLMSGLIAWAQARDQV